MVSTPLLLRAIHLATGSAWSLHATKLPIIRHVLKMQQTGTPDGIQPMYETKLHRVTET